jgi:hypothetical protein
MASGLDWKMVELQSENLVPGILLTVELSSLIPGLIEGTKGTGNSFVDGTVFIAASYALGLLSSLLSLSRANENLQKRRMILSAEFFGSSLPYQNIKVMKHTHAIAQNH